MGELVDGEFGADILGNLEYAENEFRNAQEFLWIRTDQVLKTSSL